MLEIAKAFRVLAFWREMGFQLKNAAFKTAFCQFCCIEYSKEEIKDFEKANRKMHLE